jgi:transcriptional regulator with XRE-family HTH domain
MERGLLQKDVAAIIGVDENSITGWELGRYRPRVSNYPGITKFLGYYPFEHEVESIGGKLLQVRYCNGYSCKRMAEILKIDTATFRKWELKKRPVNKKIQNAIMSLWLSSSKM